MKNIIKFALCSAILLGTTACEQWEETTAMKDGKYPIPSLEVRSLSASTNTISFSSADSKTFTVSSQNATWEIIDVPDWVTLSQSTGGELTDKKISTEITITAEENNGTSERGAEMTLVSTVKGWNYTEKISVSQGVIAPYIRFDNAPETVPFEGGTIILQLKTNRPNDVTVNAEFSNDYQSERQAVAYQYNATKKTITLTVPKNEYGSARDITVTATLNDSKTTHRLTQAGGGVSNLTIPSEHISCMGGTIEISFSSTSDWEINTSSNWLTFVPKAGRAGNNIKVKVTATANISGSSRNAYVTVKPVSGSSVSKYIYQDGVSLELSDNYRAVHNNVMDGSNRITVTATAPWSVKSTPDWARLTPASGGIGETQTTLIVDNIAWVDGLNYRKGVIKVQIDGTSTTKEIEIRQYY